MTTVGAMDPFESFGAGPLLAALAATPVPIPIELNYVATALFALAVVHTFATALFERLAHRDTAHRGFWHLLGEVEVVFGFWAVVLFGVLLLSVGSAGAIGYVESRSFAEPVFVFVIMVMAASRPIMELAGTFLQALAQRLPLKPGLGFPLTILSLAPILGSFITEPAAMTVAALLLRDRIYAAGLTETLKYAILGTLFVNISIGGALTPYAAPPILMVAQTWNWGLGDVFGQFGWRAMLATVINAAILIALHRREFAKLTPVPADTTVSEPVPALVTLLHIAFAAAAVLLLHHPVVLLGLFLVFLGFTTAYPRYQSPPILREALLVALFLAGLVVLGGLQTWWLQPLLQGLPPAALYYGATALTAITDNAALTYLGSLVEGTTPEFRYALVAGALTGGGLTIIANAPNPAGVAILRGSFEDGAISAWGLLRSALVPTFVTIVIFWFLPH
jgi:Putative Na+/H+ antiporter